MNQHGATNAEFEGEGADSATMDAESEEPHHRFPLWVVLLGNVLVALVVISVIQAWVVRVHSVASGSMLQTLGVHHRVLSSPLPYLTHGPERGDIVIFGHGETWQDEWRAPASDPLRALVRTVGDVTGIGTSNKFHTVKRVIGLPGDTVVCCDAEGRVQVNGQALNEPYLYRDFPFEPGLVDCSTTPGSSRCFAPLRVPAGHYLVLGDHRSLSADSVQACRAPGAGPDCAVYVPAERISGKVIARAWPPGPVR